MSTYTAIILLCKRRKKYAGHNYTDTNAMLRTLDVLKEEEEKTNYKDVLCKCTFNSWPAALWEGVS